MHRCCRETPHTVPSITKSEASSFCRMSEHRPASHNIFNICRTRVAAPLFPLFMQDNILVEKMPSARFQTSIKHAFPQPIPLLRFLSQTFREDKAHSAPNTISCGMCLIFSEGLAQKAQ